MRPLLPVVVLTLVAIGCQAKKAPDPLATTSDGEGAADAAAGVRLSSAALPAASASGESSPDASFAKGLAAVRETCASYWSIDHGYDTCRINGAEPWKAFRAQKLEKLEATCLALVESRELQLRWAGVQCFRGWPTWASVSRLDDQQGARFFAALQKEPADSPIDMALADLATKLSSPALKDQLRAYALAPSTAADVKIVLAVKHGDDANFALIEEMRGASDKRLVAAALDGYAVHFDKHRGEACALWQSHLEDPEKDVRRRAIGHLSGGFSAGCASDAQGYDNYCYNAGGPGLNMPTRFDKKTDQKDPAWCPEGAVSDTLAAIEKRMKADTVDDYAYVGGLTSIATHPKATPVQRRRAIAALRTMVDTKGAKYRTSVVRDLAKADPAGLAYLEKYAADPDLKSAVEEEKHRAKSR